jgi:hypothetical protein
VEPQRADHQLNDDIATGFVPIASESARTSYSAKGDSNAKGHDENPKLAELR